MAVSSARATRTRAGAVVAAVVSMVLVAASGELAGAAAKKPPRQTTTTTTTTTTTSSTTTPTSTTTTSTTAPTTTTTTAPPEPEPEPEPDPVSPIEVPDPIDQPPTDPVMDLVPEPIVNELPGMLIGTRNPGATDPYDLPAMNAWQDKTNAVVQTYLRSDLGPAKVTDALNAIWNQGSVPIVSYDLQVTNAQVVSGQIDANLDLVSTAMRSWLAGPDGLFGNGDDRRAYFRPAWEANGTWYRWSPCANGTAADYVAMWRHLHGLFTAKGIDDDHLSWIFSVNATDTRPECTMELLYPGDAYVDWTGIDGYTFTSTKSAYGVFNPMLVRLRLIAPTKPLSINEWGADSTTAVGKSAWIDGYFLVAHGLDVRMSVVFNIDKERDWAVFGGANGDETFAYAGKAYRAWSAYRENVADPRVIGASAANPRLLTDAQFQGT